MNKSILCGLAAFALCGASNVLAKALLSRFAPATLLLIELTASCVVLWLFLIWQRKAHLSSSRLWIYSLAGLLQPGLSHILATYGLNLTTADSEAIIWTSETIAIIFLAWLLFKERIGWQILSLAIIGTAGTVMAIGSNFGQALTPSMVLGNWLVVSGVVCAAVYSVVSQRQLVNIEPLQLNALHQLAAVIMVFIVWLFGMPMAQPVSKEITPLDIVWAGVSGIAQFALPFWFYLTAIKGIGVTRTSIFLVLPPIFTIIGSFLFLGEKLTLWQLLGAMLAMAAVGGICTLRPPEAVSINLPATE